MKMKGMVDSGADISLIAEVHAKELQKKGFALDQSPCMLKMANGYTVACNKMIRMYTQHYSTGKFHQVQMVVVRTFSRLPRTSKGMPLIHAIHTTPE